jgi:hypothetical protein
VRCLTFLSTSTDRAAMRHNPPVKATSASGLRPPPSSPYGHR